MCCNELDASSHAYSIDISVQHNTAGHEGYCSVRHHTMKESWPACSVCETLSVPQCVRLCLRWCSMREAAAIEIERGEEDKL